MPDLLPRRPGHRPGAGGTVAAGDTIIDRPAISLGATLGPFALAPREWARVLLEAMARAQRGRPRPVDRLPHRARRPARRSTSSATPASRPRATAMLGSTSAPERQTGRRPSRSTTAATSPRRCPATSSPTAPASGCRRRPAASPTTPPTTPTPAPRRSSTRRPTIAGSSRPLLPAESGTILCTDLNGWFAERPPGISLPRWHTGNRVEPLLDGIETFTRLWEDLQPLRAGPRPHDGTAATPLGAWTGRLVVPGLRAGARRRGVEVRRPRRGDPRDGNGFQMRLLASKLVHVRGHGAEEERLPAGGRDDARARRDRPRAAWCSRARLGRGRRDLGARSTLAAILLMMLASTQFVDAISDKLDFSKEVLEDLTPARDADAVRALVALSGAILRQPGRASFPAALIEAAHGGRADGLAPHEDAVLALPDSENGRRRTTSPTSAASTSTRTGIDSWAHRWPPNYHDVHARLTGPAAADVFQTFYERWEDELTGSPADEGPAAANTCPRSPAAGPRPRPRPRRSRRSRRPPATTSSRSPARSTARRRRNADEGFCVRAAGRGLRARLDPARDPRRHASTSTSRTSS